MTEQNPSGFPPYPGGSQPPQPPTGGPQNQQTPYGGPIPQGQAPYGQQPPAAAPRKKFSVRAIIGLAVLGFVIVGVIWGFLEDREREKLLQEGNCVIVTGTKDKADVKEASCEDKTIASLKIVKVLKDGQKCDKDYSEYYVDQKGKRLASYCLMENMFEGKCYATSSDNLADFKMVECNSPQATIKVNKRIDNSVDVSQCAQGDNPVSFDLGKRLYCLGATK